MNLIEQLGGYDAAKEYLKKNSHFINFEGLERFYDALLQYRRQHNIFEVGDKVIRLDVDNIFIYTAQKVTLDLITVVRKKKSNAVRTWGTWLGNNELRHATNEEIQAGRRL